MGLLVVVLAARIMMLNVRVLGVDVFLNLFNRIYCMVLFQVYYHLAPITLLPAINLAIGCRLAMISTNIPISIFLLPLDLHSLIYQQTSITITISCHQSTLILHEFLEQFCVLYSVHIYLAERLRLLCGLGHFCDGL